MRKLLFLFFVLAITVSTSIGQDKKDKDDALLNSSVLKALKFRSVGPGFASGRVSDIVVNPDNFSEWYVAFGSSGIWKTVNNGQTFDPIFDKYGAYAIGCLAMDPTNSNVIWAGTGENNHQRALGYGDGVYKSVDGGKSWKNMGLKKSFHIGMIAINPENTDIVFVAAEGSAWGPGDERGLYKSIDGGKNWKKVIEISENTGINNVIIDPKNPKIMYATSEQRRRRQYGKIGGGPESAVYKSVDGGENWRKIMKGLPSGDIGGMGIAISSINSDYVFLIVEKEGFYRSTDRGESWKKMGDHASSGQYYNEIFCSPHDLNTIFSVETVSKISVDGGKTWNNIGLKNRHVDDHALWINPNDSKHFIIGGDGGIYITYDAGSNYFHVGNTASSTLAFNISISKSSAIITFSSFALQNHKYEFDGIS
ncbi:MAG: YCF48-related protein, partial [Bacteroidota bacterium]|nr:YCF48-related protein [Bacteroidota bacterium]